MERIKCQAQKNNSLYLGWCKKNKHRDFCKNCLFFKGGETSIYQQTKKETK